MQFPQPDSTDATQLLEQARSRSIALLERNLAPVGILAASPAPRAVGRHYDAVFGRDAAICALAMSLSGNPKLVTGAIAGLDTLARGQAANGQIPKFVDSVTDEADFWYLGCVDATLWWLLAVAALARRESAASARWKPNVDRALSWCLAQEHQGLRLLQQNEASDWADIMPRSGFVLYTNSLWNLVKRLYALPHADVTRSAFNALFYPFTPDAHEYRRTRILRHYARRHARDRGWYLSFVNLSFCGNEGDTLGNCLAVLCGAVDEAAGHQIVRALERARADDPFPARATCEPIARGDPLWRSYMGRHLQNLEHQYHNGGIWPMVGGFWVMTLSALGRRADARQALLRLAQLVSREAWSFREWFHGTSLEPHGMTGQSWSAAGFLLAQAAVERDVFPFMPYSVR